MNRSIISMTIFTIAFAGCAAIGEGERDPALEESLFVADNGIELDNGLTLPNGAILPNGTRLPNGLRLSNGVDTVNGIQLSNGTRLPNGVSGPYYAPPGGSALEMWIDVDPIMRKRILRYLVECSLPSAVEVQILYRGELEVLGRGVGNLAPGLQRGEMTADEQRMVSACLLARVNARGEVVTIDMYGPMAQTPFWDPPLDPAQSPEGAFWGNLFAATPQAYVCSSEETIETLTRTCIDWDCGVMTYIGGCDAIFKLDRVVWGCPIWGDGYYLGCAVGGTMWPYVMTTYLGGVGGGT